MPPLSVDQPPLVPGAGPRPFRTRDDVLAHLDELLKEGEVAPVRDALVNALTALVFELQFRGEYAIAQCDLLRATEQYLTSIGGDDRMVPQAPDEGDEAYRARLLATPLTVTEEAITTGVNVILAPFTTTQCELIDAVLDRWFVGDDNPRPWHSFIGADPEYPDRLYSGQEAINGASRPNSNPGGARVYADTLGRHFTLLLPDLSGITEPSAVATTGTLDRESIGFYVGDSTVASIAAYINPPFSIPLSIYRSIESFVNSVVGQSVRWGFIAELEAA